MADHLTDSLSQPQPHKRLTRPCELYIPSSLFTTTILVLWITTSMTRFSNTYVRSPRSHTRQLLINCIDASAQWQIATTMMGAIIRVDEDMTFRYYPYDDDSLLPFHRAVEGLNPAVAVVISNAAIQAALSKT